MGTEKSEAEVLRQQYRRRFEPSSDYRDALWHVLCEDFFQRYLPVDATILDLGCGWGEFSNNIKAGHRYAMDMNPDARTRLDPNVSLLLQDCSDRWPLDDDSLDVVFTSNFLEHLPDKASVERAIREARRCLKPGGTLLALGPNVRLLPGEYWDFWDHHVQISDRSLAELLTMNGFVIREQHAGFLPYTMSDGRNPSLLLVKLYLRIPLVWKIMGKQFFIVAGSGD